MLSKCGDWTDFFLLVSELLYFGIFLADSKISLVWTSSSVDSPSMIFGASMNLYISFRRAVALPFVFGQVVYVVLVSCFVGSGLSALQLMPRWCYIPFSLLLCQSYFYWMPSYVWFGVNCIPSRYGVNLLRCGDPLLTCYSQWIWDYWWRYDNQIFKISQGCTFLLPRTSGSPLIPCLGLGFPCYIRNNHIGGIEGVVCVSNRFLQNLF